MALAPPRPAREHVFGLVFVLEKFERTEYHNFLPEKTFSDHKADVFLFIQALLADGSAVGRSVLSGGMGPPEYSANNDAGDQVLT